MEGKYIQFSTGYDGVSRQNGLEPVSQKKISSINTCNIVQCLHKQYGVDKITARPKLVLNNAALLLYMNYCLNTYEKYILI